jgi:hypothetical protein
MNQEAIATLSVAASPAITQAMPPGVTPDELLDVY